MKEKAETAQPQPLGDYQQLADEIQPDQPAAPVADEATAQGPATKELIKPLIDFNAAVFFPNWPEVAQQSDLLAESYAALIDKYLPDAASKLTVELNAAIVTVAVFGPLVASGKPRKLPEPEKPETDKPGDAEAPEPVE